MRGVLRDPSPFDYAQGQDDSKDLYVALAVVRLGPGFDYGCRNFLQRFQVAEDGWQEFGDGGVDMHCALDGGVRGAGVHGVEDAVDGFVAAGSEDGGAEDLFCV